MARVVHFDLSYNWLEFILLLLVKSTKNWYFIYIVTVDLYLNYEGFDFIFYIYKTLTFYFLPIFL